MDFELKIYLSSCNLKEDWKLVKDGIGFSISSASHFTELIVPEKCLVRPVTYRDTNEKPERISYDSYTKVKVNHVEATDILAWAPPFRSRHTELVPSTLYFAGKNVLSLPSNSDAYAFVCPVSLICKTIEPRIL